MANREACELYIEQEIKDSLEQGKKPYSIGKELSAWVERLFEVNISPHTIERRAERLNNKTTKNTTNVPKKTELYSPEEIDRIENNVKPPEPNIPPLPSYARPSDSWVKIYDEFLASVDSAIKLIGKLSRLPDWHDNKPIVINQVQQVIYLINDKR